MQVKAEAVVREHKVLMASGCKDDRQAPRGGSFETKVDLDFSRLRKTRFGSQGSW